MSRSFWASQMAFSTLLPDYDACLARMSEESAAFSNGRIFDRIGYGRDPRQWVELTDGAGPTDVLPVILHGGYWRALKAEDHRFLIASVLDQGVRIGNLEYRLMPGVRLGDVVADARHGLRALADAVPDAQLLIIGHSAGAHLALSALADAELATRVKGVIALSGIYDIRPASLAPVQDEIGLTEAEIMAHSLTPAPHWPPILYVTGDAETHEFRRQSVLMASYGRAQWQEISGANHLNLTFAARDRAAELIEALSAIPA